MTSTNRNPIRNWTGKQALLLAVICLLAGIAGGWSIRKSQRPTAAEALKVANISAPVQDGPASQTTDPARFKAMADAQVAPLAKKLQSVPNDPELLASIGNVYYDAQQHPIAVDYYERALKTRPSNASVRTDMATAYWYMGDADAAIAEFNKALTYAPNNANTLFNLGVVKWQGKKDSAGAIAAWEKLLAMSPNYEGRAKVEELMAEARKQGADHRP